MPVEMSMVIGPPEDEIGDSCHCDLVVVGGAEMDALR
jgi:hypothetical protein